MRLLAIDVGSSSVKAAILTGERPPRAGIVRESFSSLFEDDGVAPRAEVKLAAIERAIREAIRQLGSGVQRVDLIAATTMAPSWLAMDAKGTPLTNIITHQDRRSIAEAAEIERRVGKARHLKLAGNRPFPGGISSTTWAWHLTHARQTMKRATLVGHLGTWLAFALAGERIIDVSNAGFTGLMDVRRAAWSDELIAAVGADANQLPRIVEANDIVGTITPRAARRFGLRAGTPLLAGCIDGSAAMLAAGAKAGQLVNVCGSTDVLAVCTDGPHPHEDLLTRPLGVDGQWLSVGTIAAAGSAIRWASETFFAEMSQADFHRHVKKIARRPTESRVRFDPTLAGSRTSLTVASGSIEGLLLSTDRDEILGALLTSLANESAARFDRLREAGVRVGHDVLVTGGGSELQAAVFRRHWPRGMRYRSTDEATLRGLWTLAAKTSLET